MAWTENNHVAAQIDGATYFTPLASVGATDVWRQCATDASTPVATASGRHASPIRSHVVEPVGRGSKWWTSTVYRLIFDPDGRPLKLRLKRRY